MAESTRFVGAEASSLMLIDEATRELVFEVATGEKGGEVRQFRLKVGEGVAGWTAAEGRPLIVNDPRGDPRFASKVDSGTGFQTRNLMAVPLRVRERVIGVLEVVNRVPPGPFGDEHLRLLEAVAAQAGTAIEKARLYAYMEEQVNETIQMYLSLEKEKSKVETILASMIEGVVVANETGEVTLVTASARRALSPDGVRWTPEYEQVTGLLQRAVRERAEFGGTIAPDLPGRRTFGVRVAPMLTGAGKLLGAVAVLEDVTELTRLSELKNEFISQVSHELRTPLTSIRAAVNLVLRERAGPLTERQRELGALMRDDAERMTGLINDLLDISKIEAGMMRLELEEFDAPVLVGRLLDGMSALLGERGVRAVREFPPGLGAVRADQRRLERVFTNLISNAVKYSPPGSTVAVGGAPWEGEGGGVRFWVRDNGPGIPEEDRTRIFEKFQRGRDVAGIQGTGLGLAIARGVVEEHGGRIWVESGSGSGSTFCFTIPRAAGHKGGGGSG
jgi:signal transduction histidine kinase